MSEPYTIRIFVPDRDPEGAKIIELMNWTGVGIAFPRSGWCTRAKSAKRQRVAGKTQSTVATWHVSLRRMRFSGPRAMLQMRRRWISSSSTGGSNRDVASSLAKGHSTTAQAASAALKCSRLLCNFDFLPRIRKTLNPSSTAFEYAV